MNFRKEPDFSEKEIEVSEAVVQYIEYTGYNLDQLVHVLLRKHREYMNGQEESLDKLIRSLPLFEQTDGVEYVRHSSDGTKRTVEISRYEKSIIEIVNESSYQGWSLSRDVRQIVAMDAEHRENKKCPNISCGGNVEVPEGNKMYMCAECGKKEMNYIQFFSDIEDIGNKEMEFCMSANKANTVSSWSRHG